jgi:hypothetical protein
MKCGKFTTAIILCILQAWTPPCLANLSLQSGPSRYCVEAGSEEFVCSDDPYVTRKALDSFKVSHGTVEQISRGVTQRIDGTEAEQDAIKEVLSQMDRYFLDEVLSKPEYAGIRTKWYVPYLLCRSALAISPCQNLLLGTK